MKRRKIKRNEIMKDIPEHKVKVEEIPFLRQIGESHIPRIPDIIQIKLCRVSDLARHIEQAVQGTGRDPHDIGDLHMMQHQHIKHATGIYPAKCAAFQDECGLFCFRHTAHLHSHCSGAGWHAQKTAVSISPSCSTA